MCHLEGTAGLKIWTAGDRKEALTTGKAALVFVVGAHPAGTEARALGSGRLGLRAGPTAWGQQRSKGA